MKSFGIKLFPLSPVFISLHTNPYFFFILVLVVKFLLALKFDFTTGLSHLQPFYISPSWCIPLIVILILIVYTTYLQCMYCKIFTIFGLALACRTRISIILNGSHISSPPRILICVSCYLNVRHCEMLISFILINKILGEELLVVKLLYQLNIGTSIMKGKISELCNL